MDGQKLLKDYSEDIELGGVFARSLTKDAEVVVTAAYAIYKEHIILLLDCFTVVGLLSSRAIDITRESAVEKSLEIVLDVCRAIEQGIVGTPYRVPLPCIAKLYLDKMIIDPWFRETVLNIVRYLSKHRHSGYAVLWRLTRRSY